MIEGRSHKQRMTVERTAESGAPGFPIEVGKRQTPFVTDDTYRNAGIDQSRRDDLNLAQDDSPGNIPRQSTSPVRDG
jgi:hypothetical protein